MIALRYDPTAPRGPQLAAVEESFLGRRVLVPAGTSVDGDRGARIRRRAQTVHVRRLSFGAEGLFLGWDSGRERLWARADELELQPGSRPARPLRLSPLASVGRA